ncbi:MAG: hypothetical protein PHY54_05105 [Methylococcales bacterium]|nr:hypothetical protein [Methylococcales bacterium]
MVEHQKDPEQAGNWYMPREIAYLAFAALPISIYVLAIVILEQANFGSMALESKLAAINHAAKDHSALELFVEGRLHVLWLNSVLLYYILAVAVIATCALGLKRSLTPKGFKQALALWMALSCVGFGHLAYVAGNDNTTLGAIFLFTFETLQNSHFFKPLELAYIRNMVYIVNLLAAIAPIAIALTAAACLTPVVATDPRWYLQLLAERSHQLKTVVNLGSALLVAGVLHMQAWLRWPIVFVDDAKLANAMNDWSLALTTYIGSVFSLMIACIYIYCAKILAKRAVAKLLQLSADTPDFSLEDWLEKHGFSPDPTLRIPQVLAIFAPLLAGPVGAALTGLGNSVGH